MVVPLAGTWIETAVPELCHERISSFPSRERGLKPTMLVSDPATAMSFPSRERGLKLPSVTSPCIILLSFPSRERGLKLWQAIQYPALILVVPLAGTWIETFDDAKDTQIITSFPSRERGLKHKRPGDFDQRPRRSPRGNVD